MVTSKTAPTASEELALVTAYWVVPVSIVQVRRTLPAPPAPPGPLTKIEWAVFRPAPLPPPPCAVPSVPLPVEALRPSTPLAPLPPPASPPRPPPVALLSAALPFSKLPAPPPPLPVYGKPAPLPFPPVKIASPTDPEEMAVVAPALEAAPVAAPIRNPFLPPTPPVARAWVVARSAVVNEEEPPVCDESDSL